MPRKRQQQEKEAVTAAQIVPMLPYQRANLSLCDLMVLEFGDKNSVYYKETMEKIKEREQMLNEYLCIQSGNNALVIQAPRLRLQQQEQQQRNSTQSAKEKIDNNLKAKSPITKEKKSNENAKLKTPLGKEKNTNQTAKTKSSNENEKKFMKVMND